MKKTKGERRNQKGETRVHLRRLPRVPPPDSGVWPEQYRGQHWKPIYAILFAGKCQLRADSCPLSKWRQGMDKYMGMTRLLLRTNHPNSPGELVEVLPIETCRNFKAKSWRPVRAKPAPAANDSDPKVRRIPVGPNRFATVDAADYKKLSKYKWYVSSHGRNVYAYCRTRGRMVSMHRMIMRPRRGHLVDHIDGNGLNTRYCIPRIIFSTPSFTMAYTLNRIGMLPNATLPTTNMRYMIGLRCIVVLVAVEGISPDRTRS